MSASESNASAGSPRSKPGKGKGCLGCVSVLILALSIPWAVYTLNNQSVKVAIPAKSPLPAINASFDFEQAGKLVSAMTEQGPYLSRKHSATKKDVLRMCRLCAAQAMPTIASVRRGIAKPFELPRPVELKLLTGIMTRPFNIDRRVVLVLLACAVYAEATGSRSEAIRLLLDGIDFAISESRGGGGFYQTNSLRCAATCFKDLERLITTASEVDLRLVASRMEIISAKLPSATEFMTEWAYAEFVLNTGLFEENQPIAEKWSFMKSLIEDRVGKPPADMAGHISTASLMFANKASMVNENLKHMLEMTKVCDQPYQASYMFSSIDNVLCPPPELIKRIQIRQLTAATCLTLLRVETALLWYRKANGVFPVQLS